MDVCDNCQESKSDLRGGWCFKCRIHTINWDKGQLVNKLHPGMTIRESAKKVYDDGVAGGHTPYPQGDKYRWV